MNHFSTHMFAAALTLLAFFPGCSPSSKSEVANTTSAGNSAKVQGDNVVANSNMTKEEAQQKAKEALDKLLPLIEGEASSPEELARRIVAERGDEDALRENIRAADQNITYAHLKKNADRYAGKPWSFTGKILEISEVDGGTMARISLDDWGSKPVWVAAPFETDFLENNRVFVVGYLGGNYTYTSQAGWTITIPALMAREMLKPNEVAKYKSKK